MDIRTPAYRSQSGPNIRHTNRRALARAHTRGAAEDLVQREHPTGVGGLARRVVRPCQPALAFDPVIFGAALCDALHAGLWEVLTKLERRERQPGTRLVSISPRGPDPYDDELLTRRSVEFLGALATEPDAGAFVLPEVDEVGVLHGHGIALTARPLVDLERDWADRTGARPGVGLGAEVIPGSAAVWCRDRNPQLTRELAKNSPPNPSAPRGSRGWIEYITKPLPHGLALPSAARVVLSGALAPVWGPVLLSPDLRAGVTRPGALNGRKGVNIYSPDSRVCGWCGLRPRLGAQWSWKSHDPCRRCLSRRQSVLLARLQAEARTELGRVVSTIEASGLPRRAALDRAFEILSVGEPADGRHRR